MENIHVSKRKGPIGVLIFGWLLILCSLYNMTKYTIGYAWLCDTFNYWPHWLVDVRYILSWIQRILQFIAGIGFLSGSKVSRQIAIAVAIFTIATLYWRIQYPAQLIHCQQLDQQFSGIFAARGLTNKLSFVRLCIPILIVQYLQVLLFWGALLYYLTRPSIKEYFEQSSRNG